MGLLAKYQDTESGENYDKAYYGIMPTIQFTKNRNIYFQLGVYTERGKRKPLRIKEYNVSNLLPDPSLKEPPPNPFETYFSLASQDKASSNLIKCIYSYLKSLEEFKDAVDVLE